MTETDSDRIGKGINPASGSVETDFLTLDGDQHKFQQTGGIQVFFHPISAVFAGSSCETAGTLFGTIWRFTGRKGVETWGATVLPSSVRPCLHRSITCPKSTA